MAKKVKKENDKGDRIKNIQTAPPQVKQQYSQDKSEMESRKEGSN